MAAAELPSAAAATADGTRSSAEAHLRDDRSAAAAILPRRPEAVPMAVKADAARPSAGRRSRDGGTAAEAAAPPPAAEAVPTAVTADAARPSAGQRSRDGGAAARAMAAPPRAAEAMPAVAKANVVGPSAEEPRSQDVGPAAATTSRQHLEAAALMAIAAPPRRREHAMAACHRPPEVEERSGSWAAGSAAPQARASAKGVDRAPTNVRAKRSHLIQLAAALTRAGSASQAAPSERREAVRRSAAFQIWWRAAAARGHRVAAAARGQAAPVPAGRVAPWRRAEHPPLRPEPMRPDARAKAATPDRTWTRQPAPQRDLRHRSKAERAARTSCYVHAAWSRRPYGSRC